MNRPRVNEIFGLRSHARVCTIFSGYSPLTSVNYGERLLLYEHNQCQASKRSICTTFCNSPTIPMVSHSASNERLTAPEIWTLETNNRVLSLSQSTASHCHDWVLCSSFTSDLANELFQVVEKRAFLRLQNFPTESQTGVKS